MRLSLALALALETGPALAAGGLDIPAASNVIAQSGAGFVTPADTSEDTLVDVVIPANTLGATGCLRVTTGWEFTGSTNSKTMKVRFGATAGTGNGFLSISNSTASNIAANYVTMICNTSTGVQVGAAATGQPGAGTGAVQAGAIDTTATAHVSITGTKASSGETLKLDFYRVEK